MNELEDKQDMFFRWNMAAISRNNVGRMWKIKMPDLNGVYPRYLLDFPRV